MTRNILYWHRHTVSVLQYCTIITHVRTSEYHHFTAYLYQHKLFLQNYCCKIISFECFFNSIIYFQKFQQYYILQNYLSWHAVKIKSTQIIFKQEMHSNIILTLTIHKQTSLNFDDKKYCIYWHRRTVL